MSSDAPPPSTSELAPHSRRGVEPRPAALIVSERDKGAQLAVQLRRSGLVALACSAEDLPKRLAQAHPETLVADFSDPTMAEAIKALADSEELPPIIALGNHASSSSFTTAVKLDPEPVPKDVVVAIEKLLGMAGGSPESPVTERPGSVTQTAKLSQAPAIGEPPVPSEQPAMVSKVPLAAASRLEEGSENSNREDTWSLLNDLPSLADLPEIAALLHSDYGDLAGASIPKLSPQIQALLDTAARQVVMSTSERQPDSPSDGLRSSPIPTSLSDTTSQLLGRSQGPLSALNDEGTRKGVQPPSEQGTSWPAPGSSLNPRASLPANSTHGPPTIANPLASSPYLGSQPSPPTESPHWSLMPSEFMARNGSEPALDSFHPVAASSVRGSAGPLSSMPPRHSDAPRQTDFQGLGTPSFTPRAWPARGLRKRSLPAAANPTNPGQKVAPAGAHLAGPPKPLEPGGNGEKENKAAARSSWPTATSLPEPASDASALQPGATALPTTLLAYAIRERLSGALILQPVNKDYQRAIRLNEGDIAVVTSSLPEESLIHFLAARGDLNPELASARAGRLPHSGRHAAAALIAQGFLGSNELWPVLRQHAEWTLANALLEHACEYAIENEVPERLNSEPNVFGGATGVEVFIDLIQRTIAPSVALDGLGGPSVTLVRSNKYALLRESALRENEVETLNALLEVPLSEVAQQMQAGITPLLFALCSLDILSPQQQPAPPIQPEGPEGGAMDLRMDAEAMRQNIQARLALVREGNYFELLGISPHSTTYEIRRAFVTLRRYYQAERLLGGATADLHSEVVLIGDVLEEAYEVLRDAHRRNRYLRAIQAQPAEK